ncbi:hypothetical protein BJ742DRAFT_807285 [Cladochytrium replicatum]|nr:hypothetical protein BJ742DRAFT_807285 [Cladochytrium replicatum]
MINALWVGYSFSKNTFRFIWTLRTLRATLGLFATILYIPIVSIFSRIMTSCNSTGTGQVIELLVHEPTEEDYRALVACWTSQFLLRTVGTLVVLFVFVLVVIAVTLTLFEPDPKPRALLSRSHSRIELLYVGFRTLLSVTLVILARTSVVFHHGRWIHAVLCLIASTALFFSYAWYIPYYNFNFNCFRAASKYKHPRAAMFSYMANFVWASVCLIFTIARPFSDVGILFLVIAPFTFLLSFLACHARRRLLISTPVERCSGPHLIELKVRFKLEESGLLFRRPPTNPELAFTSIYDPDAPDTVYAAGPEKTEEEVAAILAAVTDFFLYGMRRFQYSCFTHISMGQFFLLQLGNRSQCLAAHSRAQNMGPALDEAFLIFRRERLLNDRFSGGDVIDFLAYEQNLKLAAKNEKKAIGAMLLFWGELLSKHPNYRKLYELASNISMAVNTAKEKYLALLKLSPDSVTAYKLYGSFLINVLNDKKTGILVLQHAEELEETQKRVQMQDTTLMSVDNCATITISGESGEIGKIIEANAHMVTLLGYKKSEIVGHNVKIIVPRPLCDYHDGFITRYLETGMGKVVDKQRQVFAVHKLGFLVLTLMAVKQLNNDSSSTSFCAVMKPIEIPTNEGYVMLNESLHVTYFTKRCGELFLSKPDEYQSGKQQQISEWIINFGDYEEQLMTATGGTITTSIRNRSYELSFVTESIPVSTQVMHICHLRWKDVTRAESVVDALGRSTLADIRERMSSIGMNSSGFLAEERGMGGRVSGASTRAASPSRAMYLPEAKTISPLKFDSSNEEAKIESYHTSVPSTLGRRLPTSPLAEERHFPAAQFVSNPKIDYKQGSAHASPYPTANRAPSDEPNITKLPEDPAETENIDYGHVSRKLHGTTEVDNVSQSGESANSRGSAVRSESARGSQASSGYGRMKNVVLKKNEVSRKRLFWLRMSFILSFVAAAIVGITNHVGYTSQFNSIIKMLEHAVDVEMAAQSVGKIMECVRTIYFSYQPHLRAAAPNLIDKSRAQIDLAYRLSDLFDFTEVITGKALLESSNVVGAWDQDDVDTAKGVLDSMTKFINLGYGFLNFSYEHDTLGDDSENFQKAVQFILVSEEGAYLAMLLNETGLTSKDQFASLMDNQSATTGMRAVLGPAIVCFMFIFFIRPIYTTIEANREYFISLFFDIPKEVIRAIYESHQQRLLQSEEDASDAGSGEDDDDFGAMALDRLDFLDEKHSSMATISKTHTYRTWAGFFMAYFENSADRHYLNLKWVCILALVIIYFLSFGIMSYLWFSEYGGSNAFWAQQRLIRATRVGDTIRTKYLQYINSTLGNPIKHDMALWNTTDNLDAMKYIEEALLYGDAFTNIIGLFQRMEPNQLVLLTTDGCEGGDRSARDYMGENCTSFADGALRRGLHSGVIWFIDVAKEIDSILSDFIESNGTQSVAFQPNNLGYKVEQLWMAMIFHFPGPFERSEKIYDDPLRHSAETMMLFHLVSTSIFISLLVFIYSFVVHPMIRSLTEDSRRMSMLLFMIPPELLNNIKSIVRWARAEEKFFDLQMKKKEIFEKNDEEVAPRRSGARRKSVNIDDRVQFKVIKSVSEKS